MKSQEARYFWTVCNELRESRMRRDHQRARLAAEELEAIAMHAADAGIRKRAGAIAATVGR
jgi:hypothetical protein